MFSGSFSSLSIFVWLFLLEYYINISKDFIISGQWSGQLPRRQTWPRRYCLFWNFCHHQDTVLPLPSTWETWDSQIEPLVIWGTRCHLTYDVIDSDTDSKAPYKSFLMSVPSFAKPATSVFKYPDRLLLNMLAWTFPSPDTFITPKNLIIKLPHHPQKLLFLQASKWSIKRSQEGRFLINNNLHKP